MALYTFIMHYDEGTFITQIKASNEKKAVDIWIKKVDIKGIKGFSEKKRSEILQEDAVFKRPILIDGCKSVWCISFSIQKNKLLAIINIIKTSL
jgi:hypothetical protein